MAVVKADAYGHGLVRMATEALAAGVEYLAVARVGEGLQLRRAGIGAPVLVFEVVPDGHAAAAIGAGLTLTVASHAGAEMVSAAATAFRLRAAVHVKIDTGMGRLGMPAAGAPDVVARIAALPALTVEGIYSHFATSEEPDTSYAMRQLELFDRTLQECSRCGVEVRHRHIANSGAIIALPEARHTLVRPGIMLYGYPPREGMPQRFPVRPVLSLVSRVMFLKTVDAGTSISYGRRLITDRRTTIATIPVGYADGYPRILTGRGEVLIHGVRYPLAGTVCMDHCMVDLGPDAPVSLGDEVVLLGSSGGERIDAQEIARHAGTIPYEITSMVSDRIPRVYTGA
jgi:alanine racemase